MALPAGFSLCTTAILRWVVRASQASKKVRDLVLPAPKTPATARVDHYDGNHQKALEFAKGARDMVKEEFDNRWPSDQSPPSEIKEKKEDLKKTKPKPPAKRVRAKEPEPRPSELEGKPSKPVDID